MHVGLLVLLRRRPGGWLLLLLPHPEKQSRWAWRVGEAWLDWRFDGLSRHPQHLWKKKKGLHGAHTQVCCNGPQPLKGTKHL